jgi:putative DNA primase/helicase
VASTGAPATATDNTAERFRHAIAAAGLQPPDEVIADGRLHRFATNSHGSDDAGWYVFHADGIPAGAFGDWRTGVSETWQADAGRRLTAAEKTAHRARLEEMRRAREAEEVRRHAEAREQAATIWNAATPATDEHAYLTRKQARAYGLRVHADGRVIVPMRDNGELHSLQFIDADGDKRFLAGGRVEGCYHEIGRFDGAVVACITEGYATGATVHMAKNYPVAVAFNAGNLAAVAKAMRARCPEMRLILCADDDIGTNGNPGLTKATEAARAVGGWLAVPDFGTDRPAKATDFNDLAAHRGLEAVAEAIMHARPVGDHAKIGGPWGAAEPAHEFVAATEAESQFLDENRILAPAAITELFSPRGLGKTLYALLLAVPLAVTGKRVLYINRDNPRHEVRRRLRACGVTAEQALDTLKVITREKAPPLTDAAAWQRFPIAEYDVVILDSFDSAAEGVGEQDSAKPSRAIAPLLDVARAMNGPAIMVLGNTVRSAAHSRGSGVVEDRADIVFEIRDATGLKPTGTKVWWEELPPAGADSWAQRATRRKRRDKYLLAFVPSKFRIGEEPDPFVIEIDLSAEPWTMRNATAELIAEGDAARLTAEQAHLDKNKKAAEALRAEVHRRHRAGTVVLAERDGVPFLMTHGLKRSEARDLIRTAQGWRIEQVEHERGRPLALLPEAESNASAAEIGSPGNPCQKPLFGGSISADRIGQARRESESLKPAPDTALREPVFPPPTPIVPGSHHAEGCDCDACLPLEEGVA